MRKHNFRAQAMVEFALALMILLLVVFGLLETGRLIFVFASTITSSREAVRYGSVVGKNDAGNLYYQDCAGIRNTAKRLGFLLNLQDEDIVIEHDAGPGTTSTEYCLPSDTDGLDDTVDLDTGDRILVTVTSGFQPIVNIIPYTPKTVVGSTERTIMGVIELEH